MSHSPFEGIQRDLESLRVRWKKDWKRGVRTVTLLAPIQFSIVVLSYILFSVNFSLPSVPIVRLLSLSHSFSCHSLSLPLCLSFSTSLSLSLSLFPVSHNISLALYLFLLSLTLSISLLSISRTVSLSVSFLCPC